MAQKPPSPLHAPPAQAAVVDEVAQEAEADRYTCTCEDPDAKLDSTGIQCDQCHSWFHSECVNVWDIAFFNFPRARWYCQSCKKAVAAESTPSQPATAMNTNKKSGGGGGGGGTIKFQDLPLDRQHQILKLVVDLERKRWSIVAHPASGDLFTCPGVGGRLVSTRWTPKFVYYKQDGNAGQQTFVRRSEVIVVPPQLVDDATLAKYAFDVGLIFGNYRENREAMRGCIEEARAKLVSKKVLVGCSNVNGKWYEIVGNNEYLKELLAKFS